MSKHVYTITLERVSTGERAESMLTRQDSEKAARAYVEAAIAHDRDLRVAQVHLHEREPDNARITRLEAALQRIVQWADAYPMDIFPEPDLKRSHQVLTDAGLSLDTISAAAMRHVISGVGEIAREALDPEP